MNQDEIIEMAIQAELNLYIHDLTEKQYIEVIKHFAKLVEERTAAKEREACAKDVEAAYTLGLPYDDVATAIRARGEA
jgi:two-component SAPR family response regulator